MAILDVARITGNFPRHDRKALRAFCDSPVPGVGATAVRPRAPSTNVEFLSTPWSLGSNPSAEFFSWRGFHVVFMWTREPKSTSVTVSL